MLIETATNVKCPECVIKLCKLREVKGILYIEIKHARRSRALTKDAIIQCFGCGIEYHVNADTQTIEEIS